MSRRFERRDERRARVRRQTRTSTGPPPNRHQRRQRRCVANGGASTCPHDRRDAEHPSWESSASPPSPYRGCSRTDDDVKASMRHDRRCQRRLPSRDAENARGRRQSVDARTGHPFRRCMPAIIAMTVNFAPSTDARGSRTAARRSPYHRLPAPTSGRVSWKRSRTPATQRLVVLIFGPRWIHRWNQLQRRYRSRSIGIGRCRRALLVATRQHVTLRP